MAAWVIREEREGEPHRRLPARGDRGPRARRLRGHRARDGRGRELQQRLGGARQAGHRSSATATTPSTATTSAARTPPASSGRSARASRAGSPATRSSSTATRPPTRTPRSTASTRWPRPSQRIWGYETTWGSFAQFTKVQAQQLLPKPAEPHLGGGGLLRPDVLHRLPHADRPGEAAGRPPRAHLGRRGRPRRVRHPARARPPGAECVGVVSSDEKGELVKQLGATDYINRNEFAGMMRKGGETPDEEKARFKVSRAFSKRVKELLGDAARHRLRARRPGDVPDLGAHRQAVRQGRDLRRDVGLQPRLRRALPVDAPEADHRLALRQRVGVQRRPTSSSSSRKIRPGAVADDGLRRRRRGAPADAREQAPRQDRDPRRRRPRRARARPRTAPARSARRSAPDGRASSTSPGTRRASAATSSRTALERDRAACRCATARRATASTATATTATSSCRRPRSTTKLDWERYWEGEEFIAFRVTNSAAGTRSRSLYSWHDLIASGGLQPEPIAGGVEVGDAQAQ